MTSIYQLIKKKKSEKTCSEVVQASTIQKLRIIVIEHAPFYRTALLIAPMLRFVIVAVCALIVWNSFPSKTLLNVIVILASIHAVAEGFLYVEKATLHKFVMNNVEENYDAETKAANAD